MIALLTTYVGIHSNLILDAQTMFLTTPLFPFPKQHSKFLHNFGLILRTKEPRTRILAYLRIMLSLGRPLQRPLARQHERGAPAASGEGRSGRSLGIELDTVTCLRIRALVGGQERKQFLTMQLLLSSHFQLQL